VCLRTTAHAGPINALPPTRDGVDAQICTGIRAGASTVSVANRLTHVVGTSLPLPLTREHDAISGPSGIFLLPPHALRKHGGGKSPHAAARLLVLVDGTLACYHRGDTAIPELGSSFTASSVLSLPPTPNHGGDSQRVDGTLTSTHRGGNAIAELGPSFLADSVFSHPPSTNDGGERRLSGRPCFASQSPAFGIRHVYRPRIC
jgi:hypothetical protein